MRGMSGFRFSNVGIGLSLTRLKLSDSKHLDEKNNNYQNPRGWPNPNEIGNGFVYRKTHGTQNGSSATPGGSAAFTHLNNFYSKPS